MSAWLNEKLKKCKAERCERNIRFTALLMAVITMAFFVMSVVTVTVSAAGCIDTEKECSLELSYHQEEKKFQNCGVKLYRVAEVSTDGTYTLTGAFADYPVKVNDVFTSTQWKEAASTLAAYAVADKILPAQEAKTDADGMVRFSTLQTGLYLVVSEDIVADKCTYIFAPFLIAVPNLDKNDNWVFDVSANPKLEVHHPTPGEIEHKVIKLWEDAGYEKNRPDNIRVEIFRDGKKVSEQILSKENNWSYFWTAPNDGSVWKAVEREVPQGYTVTARENGTTITLVNTYTKEPPVPPQPNPPHTGDDTNLALYFVLMMVSGIFLIVLGKKRTRKNVE